MKKFFEIPMGSMGGYEIFRPLAQPVLDIPYTEEELSGVYLGVSRTAAKRFRKRFKLDTIRTEIETIQILQELGMDIDGGEEACLLVIDKLLKGDENSRLFLKKHWRDPTGRRWIFELLTNHDNEKFYRLSWVPIRRHYARGLG